MRDANSWTLNCGWWGGVRVRAHASLLIVAVLAVYLVDRVFPARDDFAMRLLYPALWMAILLVSVVLHELGHLIAAWRLGGAIDLVVIGPLGGMNPPHVPHQPQREIAVALAGPLVNFILAASAAAGLFACGTNIHGLLLQPLYPTTLLDGSAWLVALNMVLWVNWVLFVVNLLPAAPLDGGRALRSVLWPATGYRVATRIMSHSGMLIALGLVLLSWLVYQPRELQLVPPWVPLLVMAIYLFFSAKQELDRMEEQDQEEELFGYDFSEGYTSLERAVRTASPKRVGIVRRWLQRRRKLRQRRLREMEQDEERRVDSILVRVKESGISSISPEERSLLQKVSRRYRDRLQS
jgi:stage IV sporulation protein FB